MVFFESIAGYDDIAEVVLDELIDLVRIGCLDIDYVRLVIRDLFCKFLADEDIET